jgi:hypothetical protein
MLAAPHFISVPFALYSFFGKYEYSTYNSFTMFNFGWQFGASWLNICHSYVILHKFCIFSIEWSGKFKKVADAYYRIIELLILIPTAAINVHSFISL